MAGGREHVFPGGGLCGELLERRARALGSNPEEVDGEPTDVALVALVDRGRQDDVLDLAQGGVTLGRSLGGPEPRNVDDLGAADGEVLGEAVIRVLQAVELPEDRPA
eukprot:3456192-Alexandrium_andersonii.AAC.1